MHETMLKLVILVVLTRTLTSLVLARYWDPFTGSLKYNICAEQINQPKKTVHLSTKIQWGYHKDINHNLHVAVNYILKFNTKQMELNNNWLRCKTSQTSGQAVARCHDWRRFIVLVWSKCTTLTTKLHCRMTVVQVLEVLEVLVVLNVVWTFTRGGESNFDSISALIHQ